ncbi:hypothetical protein P4185_30315, partial [Bacillus thuringiensis]|nr:hypothetical protein [Bacillus thuringiensis]
ILLIDLVHILSQYLKIGLQFPLSSSLILPLHPVIYINRLKVESFCRFSQNVSIPYKAEMTLSI